ncbi:MAG: CDP-glycerol glycerophosphotransferase family protein, partial [Eubacterium sp.]|nr:CDP-glycerol glycerophosphotransferase family protein [Eubacterium sp.]
LTLSPRTKLIQLWHAGAGFKSSGYSRWGHTGCPGPVSCHRQYDYGISSSDRIAHFHSEVFGINPEQLLPTGMPRMDEYLDPEYRKKAEEKLRKKFPQTLGKKVILFAPTYRGKNRSDAHYPYEMIDFDRFYKFCGDEYVVLFKMHPWVSQAVPIPEAYKDKMIDVNKYPNINDLFYITDLMITDYSSGIFEYSLMRKPMLFFAFDEIQYAFSRGFHRPYEESAPGKVCHTFDELMEAMETKNYDYKKVEEYVQLHFDNIDSKASDRVIDWILLGNVPEKNLKRINAIKHSNHMLRRMDFSSLKELESAE